MAMRGRGGGFASRSRRPVFMPTKRNARPNASDQPPQVEPTPVVSAVPAELSTSPHSPVIEQAAAPSVEKIVSAPVARFHVDGVARQKKVVAQEVSDINKLQMKAFTKNRKAGKKAPSEMVRKQKSKDRRKNEKEYGVDKTTIVDVLPTLPDPVVTAPLAPQLIIHNGKLVVDKESLVYKHQHAEIDIENTPVFDGDNARVTSMTFSKRKFAGRWTELETQTFYKGLRLFGQDFSMIAELLEGRPRTQLLRKFKREELEHPRLIQAALNPKSRLPFLLNEYLPDDISNTVNLTTSNTVEPSTETNPTEINLTETNLNASQVTSVQSLLATQAALLAASVEDEEDMSDEEEEEEEDSDDSETVSKRRRAESYESYT